MGHFRRKMPVVEAIQWIRGGDHPRVMESVVHTQGGGMDSKYYIDTARGRSIVSPSDWIVRNPDGSYEHYKNDQFIQQFEQAGRDR